MKKALSKLLVLLLVFIVGFSVTSCGNEKKDPALEKHVCKHVCSECGKCTDQACNDAACANKCAGHQDNSHICSHKCSECGKCTDQTCTDPKCADKCPGHQTTNTNKGWPSEEIKKIVPTDFGNVPEFQSDDIEYEVITSTWLSITVKASYAEVKSYMEGFLRNGYIVTATGRYFKIVGNKLAATYYVYDSDAGSAEIFFTGSTLKETDWPYYQIYADFGRDLAYTIPDVMITTNNYSLSYDKDTNTVICRNGDNELFTAICNAFESSSNFDADDQENVWVCRRFLFDGVEEGTEFYAKLTKDGTTIKLQFIVKLPSPEEAHIPTNLQGTYYDGIYGGVQLVISESSIVVKYTNGTVANATIYYDATCNNNYFTLNGVQEYLSFNVDNSITLTFGTFTMDEPTSPSHRCNHVCPDCDKCMDKECMNPVCSEKCPGHNDPQVEHRCNHVCPDCGKCMDKECMNPVCSEKCPGHNDPQVEHRCNHVCPDCDKCMDKECMNPACSEKCPGHNDKPVLWPEDEINLALGTEILTPFRGIFTTYEINEGNDCQKIVLQGVSENDYQSYLLDILSDGYTFEDCKIFTKIDNEAQIKVSFLPEYSSSTSELTIPVVIEEVSIVSENEWPTDKINEYMGSFAEYVVAIENDEYSFFFEGSTNEICISFGPMSNEEVNEYINSLSANSYTFVNEKEATYVKQLEEGYDIYCVFNATSDATEIRYYVEKAKEPISKLTAKIYDLIALEFDFPENVQHMQNYEEEIAEESFIIKADIIFEDDYIPYPGDVHDLADFLNEYFVEAEINHYDIKGFEDFNGRVYTWQTNDYSLTISLSYTSLNEGYELTISFISTTFEDSAIWPSEEVEEFVGKKIVPEYTGNASEFKFSTLEDSMTILVNGSNEGDLLTYLSALETAFNVGINEYSYIYSYVYSFDNGDSLNVVLEISLEIYGTFSLSIEYVKAPEYDLEAKESVEALINNLFGYAVSLPNGTSYQTSYENEELSVYVKNYGGTLNEYYNSISLFFQDLVNFDPEKHCSIDFDHDLYSYLRSSFNDYSIAGLNIYFGLDVDVYGKDIEITINKDVKDDRVSTTEIIDSFMQNISEKFSFPSNVEYAYDCQSMPIDDGLYISFRFVLSDKTASTISTLDFDTLVDYYDSFATGLGLVKDGEAYIDEDEYNINCDIIWENSYGNHSFQIYFYCYKNVGYYFRIDYNYVKIDESKEWPSDMIEEIVGYDVIPEFSGSFDSLAYAIQPIPSGEKGISMMIVNVSEEDFNEYVEDLSNAGFYIKSASFSTYQFIYIDSQNETVVIVMAIYDPEEKSMITAFYTSAYELEPWPVDILTEFFDEIGYSNLVEIIPAVESVGIRSFDDVYYYKDYAQLYFDIMSNDEISDYSNKLEEKGFTVMETSKGINAEYHIEDNKYLILSIINEGAYKTLLEIRYEERIELLFDLPDNFSIEVDSNIIARLNNDIYIYNPHYGEMGIYKYVDGKYYGCSCYSTEEKGFDWSEYYYTPEELEYYEANPNAEKRTLFQLFPYDLSGLNSRINELLFSEFIFSYMESGELTADKTKNQTICDVYCEYYKLTTEFYEYDIWQDPITNLIFKYESEYSGSGKITEYKNGITSLEEAGLAKCLLPEFDARVDSHVFGEINTIEANCQHGEKECCLCIYCGYEKIISESEELGEHEYSCYQNDDESHVKYCYLCNYEEIEKCSFEIEMKDYPSCTYPGFGYGICECGNLEKVEYPIDPDAHIIYALYPNEFNSPSIEFNGSIRWYCEYCYELVYTIEIPKIDETSWTLAKTDDVYIYVLDENNLFEQWLALFPEITEEYEIEELKDSFEYDILSQILEMAYDEELDCNIFVVLVPYAE